MTARPRYLRCCVCGSDAGKFAQHWNRDTGYGVCRKCVDWEISRGCDADEIKSLYGVAGVNYEPRRYALSGREFIVLAEFAEAEADKANAYMEKNPDASVLAVADGRVILADKSDSGTPIEASHPANATRSEP